MAGIFSQLWACGTVNADGTTLGLKGASVVREGVGTYLITLQDALDEVDGVYMVGLGDDGATPRFVTHTHVDDFNTRVFTMSVGLVPFDHAFSFMFWRSK